MKIVVDFKIIKKSTWIFCSEDVEIPKPKDPHPPVTFDPQNILTSEGVK